MCTLVLFYSRCLLCSEVLFGADYLLQFYISRNKLDFLFSLMAFVDVVTLFPILVFKLVCLGIRTSSNLAIPVFLGEEFLRCLDFLGGLKRAAKTHGHGKMLMLSKPNPVKLFALSFKRMTHLSTEQPHNLLCLECVEESGTSVFF